MYANTDVLLPGMRTQFSQAVLKYPISQQLCYLACEHSSRKLCQSIRSHSCTCPAQCRSRGDRSPAACCKQVSGSQDPPTQLRVKQRSHLKEHSHKLKVGFFFGGGVDREVTYSHMQKILIDLTHISILNFFLSATTTLPLDG